MAKSRYGAVARVDQSCLRLADWIDTISAGRSKQAKAQSVQAQSIHDSASHIVGKPFNPGEFVLSHVTIVSSVTTESAPKDAVPAISALVGGGFDPRTIFNISGQGGFQPNRIYPDYRIVRNTQKFINDNNDAFSQGVLKKSYRTFVGAENFLEHVQIAALSKGKILDSALRDVGDSFYVDILVATDKFHEELCASILDGTVDKMSMGCDIVGSQCSCCGHWSTDDSNLCPCIRNFKGQNFIDLDGKPSRIGELCGHESIDPTGGVTFKEASWVEGPAFKGAVSRDILVLPEGTKPRSWHHVIPSNWQGQTGKSASRKHADEFDSETEELDTPKDEKNPLDDAVQQVQQYIYDRAMSQIRDRIEEKNVQDKVPGAPNENDNIVKQASIRVAKSFVSVVQRNVSLYRQGRYEDFLIRCGLDVRRPLSRIEAEVALRIAKKFRA